MIEKQETARAWWPGSSLKEYTDALQELSDRLKKETSMKIQDELQAIYEDESNVFYCCYCLQPQGEKIGCCQENHFVEFKYLDNDCKQEIAQEILNG